MSGAFRIEFRTRMGHLAARRGCSALCPRSALRRDLFVLVASATAVQAVFPHRSDWTSHLVAGGALVLMADALLADAAGRWASTMSAVAVAVLASVAERTVIGPFDPSDLMFTLAGALLVTGHDKSEEGAPPLAVPLAWGAALLVAAVFYRYGIKRDL